MAMAKTNSYSSEHLARTNEPEAKPQISNIFDTFQFYGKTTSQLSRLIVLYL
jgi:hypothetical protein